jgi:hypothetical protein
VLILKEEQEGDPELDNTIAQLKIAEYHESKLRRFLANRLDRSNPIAFSKGSSTYSFEVEDKMYRITIEVDTFDMKHKSTTTTRSLTQALKSPALIITSTLCSAIICVLTLVSPYWTSSSVLGTLSDTELGMLDRQYSLILDRCADALMNDNDRPNPRSFGALYSTCNKAIIQLQEFCKEHQMTTCEDERVELYLTGNKPKPRP